MSKVKLFYFHNLKKEYVRKNRKFNLFFPNNSEKWEIELVNFPAISLLTVSEVDSFYKELKNKTLWDKFKIKVNQNNSVEKVSKLISWIENPPHAFKEKFKDFYLEAVNPHDKKPIFIFEARGGFITEIENKIYLPSDIYNNPLTIEVSSLSIK